MGASSYAFKFLYSGSVGEIEADLFTPIYNLKIYSQNLSDDMKSYK